MIKNQLLIKIFFLLFFIITAEISCNNKSYKEISEGEIIFDIEYLDSERENPLISLLPRKMVTEFKDNSSYSLIEGFFGTFKIINIINYDLKKSYSLLQFMDKKYVYETDINNIAFGYESMGKSKMNLIDIKKQIAGYDCKKAIIVFEEPVNEVVKDTIEIYYTQEIKIDNPNSNNPFKSIKGVLMQFTVNMTRINMRFTAQKVSSRKINQERFDIPPGFKKVSKVEMENIINEFNEVTEK
ncbi:MAG: hypothetical protein JXR51_03240 [Bacteroidales bacterium]|nr:hypothetical protein [Bacteroidales bacterium]MBN2756166.1 hypothetical protein [Bacteroidales bacterium]